MADESYSMKGWSLTEFIKGRDRLLFTIIGTVATYLVTQNPALAGIVGASSELLYAFIKYFVSK